MTKVTEGGRVYCGQLTGVDHHDRDIRAKDLEAIVAIKFSIRKYKAMNECSRSGIITPIDVIKVITHRPAQRLIPLHPTW